MASVISFFTCQTKYIGVVILFKKDASVLEIGAGCGAISGVLCRNAKHVTSVDLSKRRSLINANRNKKNTIILQLWLEISMMLF